jgi:hypoxanthine phosphoribosyltransferase
MKISSRNTIEYTFDDFTRDIRVISNKLSFTDIEIIIGITRGGAIPAVALSHALAVPTTMIDYSTRDGINIHPSSLYKYFEDISEKYTKILVVDDLVDSGVAMKKITASAAIFCNVRVATLLYNTDVVLPFASNVVYGSPFSRKEEPRYFDFWWETL